ncbi:uncharacterized protein LOC143892475 [Tasmannia lanceolata]|uniref:uncharacterized protein LOC143892475 n=1 Tax=Tasmannia lanceolata TaxID=3420 RepID=UPI004063887E
MAGEVSNSQRKSFTWSPDMDHSFCEILVRQVQLGKKGDHGTFRPEVWDLIVKELNISCNRNDIKVDYCKNRLKTLKKHYGAVKDMLQLSGFSWDSVRKMVMADRHIWDEYLKAHPEAKFYRRNSVPNFEDLCIIIGNDLTEGRRSKTSVDLQIVDNVQGLLPGPDDKIRNDGFEEEDDDMGGTGSSSMGDGSSFLRRSRSATQGPSRWSKKKRKTTNDMSKSLAALVVAIKELISNKESLVKRVVDEILKIPDVDTSFYERARKFLMADETTPLWFLSLPDDMRSIWLKDALGI